MASSTQALSSFMQYAPQGSCNALAWVRARYSAGVTPCIILDGISFSEKKSPIVVAFGGAEARDGAFGGAEARHSTEK